MEMRYSRVVKLFGEEGLEKLQNAKVILLGTGGIGSFALDCLYRTGITNITMVDFDTYEESNRNRQIGSDAVDEVKVDVLEKLYPGVVGRNEKIDMDWINNNDLSSYDLILDAIDDIPAKVEIIRRYHKKLISTTGGAKRIDPTKIEYKSLWQTENDSFAKKIKFELKKRKWNKKFKVVTSNEGAKCTDLGSFVGVTGSFGLTLCSVAVQKILAKGSN